MKFEGKASNGGASQDISTALIGMVGRRSREAKIEECIIAITGPLTGFPLHYILR